MRHSIWKVCLVSMVFVVALVGFYVCYKLSLDVTSFTEGTFV